MAMNQLSRQAMLANLAEQHSQYNQRQAGGNAEGDTGFLDYLRGTNFLGSWFS
jgi:hypothetical protein